MEVRLFSFRLRCLVPRPGAFCPQGLGTRLLDDAAQTGAQADGGVQGFLGFRALFRPQNTKTLVAAAAGRPVPAAAGNTAAPGKAVPAATTVDTIGVYI